MNKFIALAAIGSLVVTGAFAGQNAKPKAPAKTPTKIKCAVQTGNDVNIAEATKHHMYADYKGNRYFFCCDGCPQQFKANPAKFAKSAHIKSPKTK